MAGSRGVWSGLKTYWFRAEIPKFAVVTIFRHLRREIKYKRLKTSTAQDTSERSRKLKCSIFCAQKILQTNFKPKKRLKKCYNWKTIDYYKQYVLTISVQAYYTNNFRRLNGGRSGAKNRIREAIRLSNTAFREALKKCRRKSAQPA